ncbi:MAG: hypothetical protein D6714_14440, partial [Bacteroidetes bacterium]
NSPRVPARFYCLKPALGLFFRWFRSNKSGPKAAETFARQGAPNHFVTTALMFWACVGKIWAHFLFLRQ